MIDMDVQVFFSIVKRFKSSAIFWTTSICLSLFAGKARRVLFIALPFACFDVKLESGNDNRTVFAFVFWRNDRRFSRWHKRKAANWVEDIFDRAKCLRFRSFSFVISLSPNLFFFSRQRRARFSTRKSHDSNKRLFNIKSIDIRSKSIEIEIFRSKKYESVFSIIRKWFRFMLKEMYECNASDIFLFERSKHESTWGFDMTVFSSAEIP